MLKFVVREDRLKRFTATPHAGDFGVMGRTVRVETNSLPVLRHARRALEPCGLAFSSGPRFVLRIVSEPESNGTAERGEAHAVAAEGLWLEHHGPHCFFALDEEACMAMAYVPDDLVASEAAFARNFLGPLLERIASAFGVIAIPAVGLVMAGRAVLLFGSESERLAVGHATAGLGPAISSHQATFLELDGKTLLAWGRAWRVPAGDSEPPEGRGQDATAHRSGADPVGACRPARPAFSVFPEGEASDVPRLIPLSPSATRERLEELQLLAEHGPVNSRGGSIRSALACLPAYRLVYGSARAAAAIFVQSLLKTTALLEARR